MKTVLSPLTRSFALIALACSPLAASAQDKPPAPGDAQGYAYAAPAFIKELDTRYPAQPPVPSAPRYGGVLHFPATIRAFDPMAGYRPELALVWDTLTEWEATWIFKLRQGVRFHNRPPVNGREMTADDVKYSYELLKDKAQYSTRAALVKTITVVDKYTVKFELSMPDPRFYLNVVDSLSPVIVPREAVEAPGGLAENPIGTGAFMLKEFAPGEGALLVRNPSYYLKDHEGRQLPYVDAVRLFFTKDPATDTALFRTRQLDLMRVSTLDVLYALMKTVPDLSLYRVPSFGWGDYGVSMALDRKPYSDVRVRQALSMAINRDVVAEVINRGDAALYGPFPWALAGYTKRTDYTYENLGPYYQYNPARAKELLAEAGYPKGFEMTIEWAEWRGYVWGEFVQLLSRFFEDIGMRVKVKRLEGTTWNAMRLGGQPFTDALVGWSPPGSGPGFVDWVHLPYHSASPKTINIGGVNDPKLDQMLDQWRLASDEQQPALQRDIWDYLRDQVYRLTTIVPPHYRITQSYLYAGGSPYCWFVGFCSYEGKTAWVTDKAPVRKFDKFAQ